MTERRRFIVKAGGAMAAVAAAAIVDAPNVIAQPKVQWRMSTTWTAGSFSGQSYDGP
jgi:TRAP-type mannitol/chloroaromatic compound transport system substrate-binding protein